MRQDPRWSQRDWTGLRRAPAPVGEGQREQDIARLAFYIHPENRDV
jgi:hypothetical protein